MKYEVRADGSVHISGYVNAVERLSKPITGDTPVGQRQFLEKVAAGAFSNAIKNADEIGLFYNHTRSLGGTKTNLKLEEDSIGLHADAVIADPEVRADAEAGRLSGWSFAFYSLNEDWRIDGKDGMPERRLLEIDLKEVSLLNVEPAYSATSVEVRSGDETARKLERRAAREDESTFKAEQELRLREIEILELQKKE